MRVADAPPILSLRGPVSLMHSTCGGCRFDQDAYAASPSVEPLMNRPRFQAGPSGSALRPGLEAGSGSAIKPGSDSGSALLPPDLTPAGSRSSTPFLVEAPRPESLQVEGWNLAGALPTGVAAALISPAARPAAPAFPGYDRADMDLSVAPGADFYRYAVGGYLARRPIPDDRPRSGVDEDLAQQTQANLKALIEDLAVKSGGAPPGSDSRKLGDLYAVGMDQAAVDAAGLRPLQPMLDRIDRIQDLGGVQDVVAEFHASGIGSLFNFGASVDVMDSSRMIAETFQGGLGLPDREYYLKDDEDKVRVRQAYRGHLERMFELMGEAPEAAGAHADTVMAVERRLAEASLSRAEMRDPYSLYHPTSREQLAALTPAFSWDRYLDKLGRPDLTSVNVATPDFFTRLNDTLTGVSLEDWKTYLRWNLINATAPYLSSDFENQNFEFKFKQLKGIQAQPPRWKRVLATVDECLGDALGKKYVERHFPPEAKARVQEMVGNIKLVLEDKIERLSWMSEETRQQALEKLDSFSQKLGYPDRWEDYSRLEVDRGSYVGNVLRASGFAVRNRLDSIGKPVDRTRWEMTPPTINAYYQPVANEIVFPAGILQGVYFNPVADDATNYGAIGAVIGHEIGHGFDDEGAQFDGKGNLRNWWTDADLVKFRAKAEGVANQFDEFQYDGVRCNGKLVTGEAMADLGGLELAYEAYKLAREGKPPVASPDGFSDDQRFFLSYAKSWATNVRPEYARLILQTDPHPLPEFRVNGTLANLPAFHEAFGLSPQDPMVRPPEKRNTVWN